MEQYTIWKFDIIILRCSCLIDLTCMKSCACKKSLIFFHLWKLWIKYGNHGVCGNTKNLNLQDNFISSQCFLDIQISSHFVVILITYFGDNIPVCQCFFHLTGSASLEIIFARLVEWLEWNVHTIFIIKLTIH